MTTVTSLFDVCDELLTAAVAALDETDVGAPTHRYVAPAPVAADCEQVTVHAAPITLADTAPQSPALQPARRIVAGNVNLVGLVVTVMRCVPVVEQSGTKIKVPSAAKQTEAARVILADGWALWNGLKRRHRDNTLLPAACRDVFLDPAVPLDAAGGFGGWQLVVRTNLDGIAAEPGS